MEDEKRKALFYDDDRVEIRFEKLPGTVTFKRSIAALTVDSAVKALASLISHLAELCEVHPGDVLTRVAMVLLVQE
jgi:hypothetical protein